MILKRWRRINVTKIQLSKLNLGYTKAISFLPVFFNEFN